MEPLTTEICKGVLKGNFCYSFKLIPVNLDS